MSFAVTDVLALEERALNAWPALRTEMVGGWALRFAGGCTKRANSANAVAPAGDFREVMLAAEALYAGEGLPSIFRISPLAPVEADIMLDAAGYTLFDPSSVMCARIDSGADDPRVLIEEQPSIEWLEGIARANDIAPRLEPLHSAIIRSIAQPAAFATLWSSGRAAAFGLAVLDRGMVGLFDIVVMPSDRGCGYGRAITNALMRWGYAGGARTAYLQVRRANEVASTLYASAGFIEAYRYHYRIPPR